MDKVEKTEQQWQAELTPDQFRVMRLKGTEPPFSGEYYQNESSGRYCCAGCKLELFGSDAKYDSGSGWPSFYQPAEEHHVEEQTDDNHGMRRTEVLCSSCGAHLGHVFPDGPKPTGLRYCINSVALAFEPDQTE